MRSWMLVVLVLELAVMALVLILPQVDLLDTALEAGTTPIAVRTTLSGPPFQRTILDAARIASKPLGARLPSGQNSIPGPEPLTESLRLPFLALLC